MQNTIITVLATILSLTAARTCLSAAPDAPTGKSVAIKKGAASDQPRQAQHRIAMVRDGKSSAVIVTGRSPTKSAQLAAAELQCHVEEITGAKLPVVTDDARLDGTHILVGESEATTAVGLRNEDFKPQEYLVRCGPGLIVLMGRDADDRGKLDYSNEGTFPDLFQEQGACYAVYDFLEKLCGSSD
jgi:hypothetical protein